MEWQNDFSSHIILRGYNYYLEDRVIQIQVVDNRIKAVVRGSFNYLVYVKIKDDQVYDLDCDCPYADQGELCKHMAAVLFKYEEEYNKTIKSNNHDNEETFLNKKEVLLNHLVEIADQDLLKEYLIRAFSDNTYLYEQFKDNLVCELKTFSVLSLKQEIKEIIHLNGEDGVIEYYNTSQFFNEIDEFINNNIEAMIIRLKLAEAFEVLNYLYQKVSSAEVEDRYRAIEDFLETTFNLWQRILDKADKKLEDQMFYFFKSQLTSSLDSDFVRNIEDFIFENFIKKDHLRQKLGIAEAALDHLNYVKGYFYKERSSKWILRYIETLKALGSSVERINQYIVKNLNLSSIRLYYIDSLIEKKDYLEAVKILKEGKIVDQDHKDTLIGYSLSLKDLYKKLNNKKAYLQEMWLLVTIYKPGNLDLFREFKSLFKSDDWQKIREEIFKQIDYKPYLKELYVEEKLFDYLLILAKKSSYLDEFLTYEDYLKALYPNEMLNQYEVLLKEFAKVSGSRSRYQEIVKYLKKMQAYPGGDMRVVKLVNEWKLLYKSRPAMMQELKRI